MVSKHEIDTYKLWAEEKQLEFMLTRYLAQAFELTRVNLTCLIVTFQHKA